MGKMKFVPRKNPFSSPRCFNLYLHRKRAPKRRRKPQSTTVDLREPLVNQTNFSLSLAKHVITAAANGTNFVFSPLSIHVVLGMLAAGSGGPARDELLGYLRSKSIDELSSMSSHFATELLADGGPLDGPRLSFANGVWVDRSFTLKPAFRKIVENSYKAATKNVDFRKGGVTKQVNDWVKKETNDLIEDLLPPAVDSTTVFILANALYFKGAWIKQFDTCRTRHRDFFLSDGNSVQAPFMTSSNNQYVRPFDDFKVLRLPYEHGKDEREFSMYIFLPDARDGLPALIEKMGSESEFIERHIPCRQVRLQKFYIPKFKMSFGFEASGVLRGQGLVGPFSPGGLSEMAESGKGLCVTAFFHKSFIEVNEQGTEAAAASACRAGLVSKSKGGMDFVADHPFMFVVREDKSGVVLFVGQVVNPISH